MRMRTKLASYTEKQLLEMKQGKELLKSLPRDTVLPWNPLVSLVTDMVSRESFGTAKDIRDRDDVMIIFSNKGDMIAFDSRDEPLNYQDVLHRGNTLYRKFYKQYTVDKLNKTYQYTTLRRA